MTVEIASGGVSAVLKGLVSRGVRSAAVDENGRLIFTMTDGSTLDLGQVTGAAGARGETGPAGPQGPKGDTGPQGPQGEPGQDADCAQAPAAEDFAAADALLIVQDGAVKRLPMSALLAALVQKTDLTFDAGAARLDITL